LQTIPICSDPGADMANTATLKPAKPQPQPPAPADAPASLPSRSFAMLSHRGRVRHINQDACAALPALGAFVVCDGIGGAAAGEIASHLAAEAFLHSLSLQTSARRSTPKPPARANGAGVSPSGHPYTRLQEAVRAANQAVFRHSRKSPGLRGMGTTLVAAFCDPADPATLWLAHVGDSRGYLFRRGALQLLTEDHSLVEEQIRAGTLSRVQAAASPIRNIITRAIGSQPAVEADIAAHPTQPGDVYLLASDGLTRELSDARIGQILIHALAARAVSASSNLLETACQALIDAANAHGGRDNITVLLIACP
jgi:serine/threonine protein phosphatase PrpC